MEVSLNWDVNSDTYSPDQGVFPVFFALKLIMEFLDILSVRLASCFAGCLSVDRQNIDCEFYNCYGN